MSGRAIILHSDVQAGIASLEDAQAGQILKGLIVWAGGGEGSVRDPVTAPFFAMVLEKQKEYAERWDAKCEAKRSAGRKGGQRSGESRREAIEACASSAQATSSKGSKTNKTKTKTKTKTKHLGEMGEGKKEDVGGSGVAGEQSSGIAEERSSGVAGEQISGVTDERVTFDRERGEFVGIGEKRVAAWGKTYPMVDVVREIDKAAAWLADNPRKMKKDLVRFLGGWMRRADGDSGSWRRSDGRGRRTDGGAERRMGETGGSFL